MQGIERAPLQRAPRRDHDDPGNSLLYPLMLIAAIAVIVFSIVGIASLMGVMPRALSDNPGAASKGATRSAPAAGSEAPRNAPAAGEPRSGVVKSIHPVQTRVQPPGLRAVAGAPVSGIPGSEAPGGGPRPTPLINQQVTYRVHVRMDDDGRLRTFYETAPPVYGVGQKVLVTGRTILGEG